MLAEELPALVTGAGEGGVGRFGVVLERVEERWQQAFFIGLGCGFQLMTMVLGVVAGRVKNAIDLQQYIFQMLVHIAGASAGAGGGDQENRDIEAGALQGFQGAGHHIFDGEHGDGDVGVIGPGDRDDLAGGVETVVYGVARGYFQCVHAGKSPGRHP
ncbi:hypothetical protein D3C72_1067330 [compost metagenome]